MAATVLYMSVSVDGFVAGPNAGPDNGLGDGGERLHEWIFGDNPAGPTGHQVAAGPDADVVAEFLRSGAVLAGRGTFEPAGGWGGDHHDGVPIFILSRHPAPSPYDAMPLVTYLPDLADAVARARVAAGERHVMVHGAGMAQRMLRAGLLDEIQLHVVPVLLGAGRRLFDGLGPEHVELEPVSAAQGAEALHVRYRVRHAA